jgi:hypothetical protein
MNGGRRGKPSPPENPMPMNQRKGAEATKPVPLRGFPLSGTQVSNPRLYNSMLTILPNLTVITGQKKFPEMIWISKLSGFDLRADSETPTGLSLG